MVYSRRIWSKRKTREVPREALEAIASPLPLLLSLSDEDSSNSSDSPSLESNDLDVPIALRKGVRSCAQHPISNFVSYLHLYPFYQACFQNFLC